MNSPTLNIKATRNTPAVVLDIDKNTFTIAGNSIPENAGEFYGPIIEQVKQGIPAMADGATFTFCLPYFNSSSLKAVYLLLTEIKAGIDSGKSFEAVWHVEEEDDFMAEAAETFTEMSGIEFTLKTGILEASAVE